MDHSQAPVLDALAACHRQGQTPFTPPGHKQGRGADPRVREVLGDAVFRSDLLATSGLDDRRSSAGVLARAQELMADAVGATHTFFSTCGSSLSVKAAMLSVAGPHEKLIVGRDAPKSVVSGLVLAGIVPVWADPPWDPERHLAHPPSAEAFRAALAEHPDARGALVTAPTPYGTCSDLSGIVQVCHEHGAPLTAAGCRKIFADKKSGKNALRPELKVCHASFDAGDTLVVPSLDRCGRSLQDLINVVAELRERGIGFASLHENLDTTTPGDGLVCHVFAAIAEFIRELIVIGTNVGLVAACVGGRPTIVTEEVIRAARGPLPDPGRSSTSIAKLLGVSRAPVRPHPRPTRIARWRRPPPARSTAK